METENSLLTDIDLIVPIRPSISTIPTSLFAQYKVSLETSSNSTSQVLLKCAWDKHFQELTKLGLDKTLATKDKNPNSVNWTSSLSKFGEPELMFEKSLCCPNKCSQASVKHFGLNSFVKYLNETDHSHEKIVIKENMMPAYSDSTEPNNAPKIPIFKLKVEKSKPSKNNDLHKINFSDESILGAGGQFHKCDEDEEENKVHKSNVSKITFKTAREQLIGLKRTLGASRKSQNKFISPMIRPEKTEEPPCITDERLKHIDPKMIELIESEIIDRSMPVGWDDVAGLEMAKSVIQEAVVWPLLRPDIFTGLRRPPKGILLFGPPGTGKTLIGKCVASQCRATFFSISASSLTSKWIGDGEKMVRALFAVARCHQPAVIFIDEIDSLLTQRSDSEHESTRRIKTEFLVQLDGAATGEDDRLLIIGATNRPQELDEAARRRLVKRLYIPLPDVNARKQIVANLLKNENNDLKANDIDAVAASTDGYSGADMKSLCSDAAMGPIRALPLSQIVQIESEQVRPVNFNDFKAALQRVKPSVSQSDLTLYENWNKTYGHGF